MKEPNLIVGQVVKTMGRQITVPDWHEVANIFRKDSQGASTWERVGSMPCIRLSCGYSHGMASEVQIPENWNINTNSYNQSGLVCFVPESYLGMAILSVRITKINQNSVIAEPVEWIEFYPKLDCESIGEDAPEIYDLYKLSIQECQPQSEDHKAIWHYREEA